MWYGPEQLYGHAVEKVEYFGSLQVGTTVIATYKAGFVLYFAIDTIREQEYFSFRVLPGKHGASTKWYFELKDNYSSTQLTMGTKISGITQLAIPRSDLERSMEYSVQKIAANLFKR